ncbi:transcription activator GLK1-like isoform X2 [Lotus japonicus]|uniref:transcription activator GLK1-like isoform X2 n=1 Tax=Lotus japonicus TaxID=34305 RepID=UPI0025865FA2|nr:transcription activator GLK1-like isoform X2 [Lotus japonicus]
MLVVSPLRSNKDENQEEMESFSFGISNGGCGGGGDEFGDFSEGNLLDNINFDDLFTGISVDRDALPDLEVYPEMFAEFSLSGGEDSEMNSSVENSKTHDNDDKNLKKCDEDKTTSSSSAGCGRGEEIVSKRDESMVVNPSPKDGDGKGRKSSAQTKNNLQGKRKVKVDWTPELHRRFVQAVEQLGVDKAVPSRIREIMGIDCLTRHNIASHLQKYRSHRKHLLAREAEAASWNQRRQMYGVAGGVKREVSPWLAPTIGFPPMTPPPMHHFRPLHVWGHPSTDQSFMNMWPKHPPHSRPSPPLPLPWVPTATSPAPQDPKFWHAQHQQKFGCPPVPGIPPPLHAVYKTDVRRHRRVPAPAGPILNLHPSKESIDAAIGDVLSKPWLPLPLGLKAPALDSVIGELQRQGVSNIPPSCEGH